MGHDQHEYGESHEFLSRIPGMSEIHLCREARKEASGTETEYQVAIAAGFHLFPSRTEKLSPCAPMVLLRNAGE